MKNTFLSIIFSTPLYLFSVEKPIKFLSRIISESSSVLVFNYQQTGDSPPLIKLNDLPPGFEITGQSISKNSKGLFLNHLGTGRIYRWIGNADRGFWKRIDQTYYTGYNFLSLFFSSDSTLYSFGGVGFWYYNGNLRKYNNSSNEWSTKSLNKSIPWLRESSQLYYIDTLNSILYFNGQGRHYDASLKNPVDSTTLNKLYKLEYKEGNITELGIIKDENFKIYGQTPWGVITSIHTLADISNNKYYTLSYNVENNLARILKISNNEMFHWQYTFWIDSTLYFGSQNNKFDSIVINKSDLTPTNSPVYSIFIDRQKDKNTSNNIISIVILASSLLVVTIIYYSIVNRRKKQLVNSEEIIKTDRILEFEKYKLTEIERELIMLIYENSILSNMTSINDINRIIGCADKKNDIQKKLRSDALKNLNQKLSLITGIRDTIIERKRADFDKRAFEYYIKSDYLKDLNKILF